MRRGAEALERTERDQRPLTPREAAEERAEREDQRPGDEDASPAEQVRGAAAQQEEAAEHERVGADHPLQVLLREPEIELDRRQRDVDDRDVEDGHELHREDERECEPFLSIRGNHENPRSSVCAFEYEGGDATRDTCDLQVKTSISAKSLDSAAWQAATTSTARWRTPSTSWGSAGRCSSSASCSRTTSSATRISTRRLDGCGTNILAARLKTLEQGGVVRRQQLDPPAASWVYELTEYGEGLREVLHVLAHWGARSLRPPAVTGDLEPGWLPGALRIALPSSVRGAEHRVPDRRRGRLDRRRQGRRGRDRRARRDRRRRPSGFYRLMVDRDLDAVSVEGDAEAVRSMLASLPPAVPLAEVSA